MKSLLIITIIIIILPNINLYGVPCALWLHRYWYCN